MWQALLMKVAIKFGTMFLLNLAETTVKVLKERTDNGIGQDDVERIQKVKNDRLNPRGERDANY